MGNTTQEQTIIATVKDWRDRQVQGTILFSTHLLMRYWEAKLLENLGWLGGVNLSLFGGLVESLTHHQSLGRNLGSSDQEFLVWGIVHRRMEKSSPALKKNLAQAGMSRAITRLFRELKQAEVTPEVLADDCLTVTPEIKEVFHEYQRALTKVGKADPEDGFRDALRILSSPQGVPEHLRRVLVVGFQEFTGTQREILSLLKTQGEVVICEEPVITDLLKIHERSGVLKQLFTEKQFSITGLTGSDREWEVRGIAREIRHRLAVGRDPADIAVIFRNTEVYLPIVQKVFLEFEIPVEREPMPAWTNLPKLNEFFLYLKVVAANGGWNEMTRLLSQRYSGFYGRIIDNWLCEDFAENGAWLLSTEDWVEWLEKRSLTADPRLAESMMSLAHLFAMKTPVTLGEFWQVGRAFFDLPELNVPGSAEEINSPWFMKGLRIRRMQAVAFEAWENWNKTTQLLGWQDISVGIDEFLNLIEQLFAGYRIPEYRRPGEGVVITNPSEIKGTRFPVIFLGGLIEGEYPRTPSRSGLIDPESLKLLREKGYLMKTPEEFLRGERENFYQLVKAATEELVLSCPAGDAGGRPQPLSVFLREARKVLGTPGWPVHTSARRFLYPPVSKKELQFNRVFHLPSTSVTCLTERRRRQGESRYVGFIGESSQITGRLADRFSLNYPFSISALEEYARCPFVFYCRKVLGIEPLKTPALMADPVELGIASHEILRVFLEEYAGVPLNPEARDNLRQILDELLEQKFSIPTSDGDDGDRAILRRMQREVLRKTVRHFLTDELDWQARINYRYLPSHFELEFGTQQEKGLLLGTGGDRVRLVGKIDRIDFRSDRKAFIIFDYKSNRVPTRSDMEKGWDLQIPLYLLAVEAKFPGSESKGGGYYSLMKRERTKGLWRKSWVEETGVRIYKPVEDGGWTDELQKTVNFILQYVSAIRKGDFRLTRGECRNGCMYRPVCRRIFSGGMADEDE